MATLIREGHPMYCAHFPGGDPRRFEPDEDCCTEEEMDRWKVACEAAEQRPDLQKIDGAMVVTEDGWMHLTMFGPGVFYYEVDPFDGIDDGEVEEASAF